MASNKTLKKFCNLDNYVEQVDPAFYAVFEKTCQYGLLRPARGSTGITLLFPKDKAYRDNIIKTVYSSAPEPAIDMLKALVLKDFYPNLASFKNAPINNLNQKLIIDSITDKAVKLVGGLEITPDPKFMPMSFRTNIAVYLVSGKGEMPTKNPVTAFESKPLKSGGFSFYSKGPMQELVAKQYAGEIGLIQNIYVKKVYLQLKELMRPFMGDENSGELKELKSKVREFLGNDEFSDSYLLDMFCDERCNGVVLECMRSTEYRPAFNKITKAHYIAMKNSFLETPNGNDVSVKDPHRLKGISNPIDIRLKVMEHYNNDKQRVGRDLFIVYCNISRDQWNTSVDAVDLFNNFAYVVGNVYTKCTDMVSQDFDIPRDLTIYGNLLKSDVFKYVAQTTFDSAPLSLPTSIPSPLDMGLYSLCRFINMKSINNTTGGNSNESSMAYLLGDL